jgi:hypothetical protein
MKFLVDNKLPKNAGGEHQDKQFHFHKKRDNNDLKFFNDHEINRSFQKKAFRVVKEELTIFMRAVSRFIYRKVGCRKSTRLWRKCSEGSLVPFLRAVSRLLKLIRLTPRPKLFSGKSS